MSWENISSAFAHDTLCTAGYMLCDSCPQLRLILSRLSLQISWNWSYTHFTHAIQQHTCAHRTGLVHPPPLSPYVLCLFGCLSVSDSLPLYNTHTRAFIVHVHANTCIQLKLLHNFFSAVAQCLSSHDSSVEIRPTQSSAHSNLQVRCVHRLVIVQLWWPD